ncbi:MAG TPA: Eco57I restriction-modification methylase domain-containing protein, partial [Chloroflexia bacterium]|nr:Eco57I restriction-modification methylase domain-containing protein [Chloroflexia bacterium]
MTATEPRPLAAEAPLLHETPLAYATRLAFQYTQEVAAGGRHDLGQFFTPPAVACFMAALATPPPTIRRVLDPGAGTGILAGALCEALPGGTGPVHLDAYELDPLLNRLCQLALGYATRWLAPRGIHLTFTVHAADFVLVNAGALTPRLLDQAPPGNYDLAIANPPYFKLPKSDPRARAAASIVHGQPNIYALFLAITGQLLAPGGVMVTITPRSFTTGDYFRLFRQYFFDTVTPEAVHLFQSRTATFQQDAVLQETV